MAGAATVSARAVRATKTAKSAPDLNRLSSSWAERRYTLRQRVDSPGNGSGRVVQLVGQARRELAQGTKLAKQQKDTR